MDKNVTCKTVCFKYQSLSFGTRVTSQDFEAGVAADVARVVVVGEVAFVVACLDTCVVAFVDATVAAAGDGDGVDDVVVVTLGVDLMLL